MYLSTCIVRAAKEGLLDDTHMRLLCIVQCAVTSPQLEGPTHRQDRELVCFDQRPAQPSIRNLEIVEASLATSTPALPSIVQRLPCSSGQTRLFRFSLPP